LVGFDVNAAHGDTPCDQGHHDGVEKSAKTIELVLTVRGSVGCEEIHNDVGAAKLGVGQERGHHHSAAELNQLDIPQNGV
jgi:hypothetical protein